MFLMGGNRINEVCPLSIVVTELQLGVFSRRENAFMQILKFSHKSLITTGVLNQASAVAYTVRQMPDKP
jgi:hypothetical protein